MTQPVTSYASNIPLNLTTQALIPTSLLTATTYTSPILPLFNANPFMGTLTGFGATVVALHSSQVVTITVQRYLDAAGLIPVEAAASVATTANTAAYVVSNAAAPAYYVGFTISNASGSTATITNPGVAALPLAG